MDCIVELHFLPLLSTYGLLTSYDNVIIEANENYQKGSYRNKTFIAGPASIQLLSVPLRQGKHKQSPILEVEIFYETDWVRTFLRTLKTAYGSTPFYDYYFPEIRQIFEARPKTLWELNLELFQYLNQRTGNLIQFTMSKSFQSSFPKGSVDDLRNQYSPRGKKPTCPTLPMGYAYGQSHADKFGFRSPVSVLDLLFHRGPESFWKIQEIGEYFKKQRRRLLEQNRQ